MENNRRRGVVKQQEYKEEKYLRKDHLLPTHFTAKEQETEVGYIWSVPSVETS